MVILADFGPDVQHYAQTFTQLIIPRPTTCPHCAAADRCVGHGSYPRTVVDARQAIPIRVRRFLCAACRKTVSVLPSFCLPCRHYLTAVIQTVLDLRVRANASWSAVCRRVAPGEVPTQTTCREWVRAFRQRSPGYLHHLLRHLAQWHLRPGTLEVAVTAMAAEATPPQQLVAAVPHLVAFLHDQGIALAEGAGRWLATLTQWGHARRLGRLV